MENVSEPILVMPVERKDGTYALRICVNQGLLTLGMMKRIMDVMEKHELPSLRSTTGQRFNLEGIPAAKLDEIVGELGTAIDKCPPGISVCPGGAQCKYAKQPTRQIGDRLLDLIKANGPYPFKIKSGVSGCGLGCGLSYVRDIGLIGSAKGWNVHFGGSAIHRAGVGPRLGKGVSEDEALALIEKALAYYKENGRKFERTGSMLKRIGEEGLLEAVK